MPLQSTFGDIFYVNPAQVLYLEESKEIGAGGPGDVAAPPPQPVHQRRRARRHRRVRLRRRAERHVVRREPADASAAARTCATRKRPPAGRETRSPARPSAPAAGRAGVAARRSRAGRARHALSAANDRSAAREAIADQKGATVGEALVDLVEDGLHVRERAGDALVVDVEDAADRRLGAPPENRKGPPLPVRDAGQAVLAHEVGPREAPGGTSSGVRAGRGPRRSGPRGAAPRPPARDRRGTAAPASPSRSAYSRIAVESPNTPSSQTSTGTVLPPPARRA